MVITVEGVDGVGKSTLIRGKDGKSGLFRELNEKHQPFILEKAPGGPDFSPLHVERSLDTVDFFLWAASERCQDNNARRLIDRVREVQDGSAQDIAFSRTLGEFVSSKHPRYAPEKDEDYRSFLALDPTLRARIDRQSPRGSVRQALMHCADSTNLSPLHFGLLFSADHLMLQHQIKQKGGSYLIDRYIHSQFAYGRVREDPPLVEELLSGLSTVTPDLTVLLVADENLLTERLFARAKEEDDRQKVWGYTSFMLKAQREYLNMAESSQNRWVIIDTTNETPQSVVTAALEAISVAT